MMRDRANRESPADDWEIASITAKTQAVTVATASAIKLQSIIGKTKSSLTEPGITASVRG